MNRASKLFTLFALAVGATALAAGAGTIEGVVVGPNGAPLTAGVRVTIRCGAVNRVAALDASGGFRL